MREGLIGQIAEAPYVMQVRMLAMKDLLIDRGVLTEEKLNARMVAMDEVGRREEPLLIPTTITRSLGSQRFRRNSEGAQGDHPAERAES